MMIMQPNGQVKGQQTGTCGLRDMTDTRQPPQAQTPTPASNIYFTPTSNIIPNTLSPYVNPSQRLYFTDTFQRSYRLPPITVGSLSNGYNTVFPPTSFSRGHTFFSSTLLVNQISRKSQGKKEKKATRETAMRVVGVQQYSIVQYSLVVD